MRVAYFTPVSPQKTGISDYSEREMLPYFINYVDIDIFIDKNVRPTNQFILENFNIYSYSDYIKRKDQYDTVIYHMGNNAYHKFIYDTLVENPGITVLHDIYLHGFLWNSTLSKGNKKRYIEEFKYCYGEIGREIAEKAIKTGLYPDFEYPLIKRILDNSLGVVCHSDYGMKKVYEERNSAITVKINHPFTVQNSAEYDRYSNANKKKLYLRLDKGRPVITSFGFINSHKRYHIVLKSFKKFLQNFPNAILLLVGQDLMGIDKLISNLHLHDSVIITGYASHGDVLEYLAISDFCINLRYPTAGETSGSVLHIMAAEKPVIVSNVGWFSEIPDNCCLKVDVDSYEEETLLEYMRLLASDERVRKQIGKSAREYVMNEHDPQRIAREYYVFIKNVLDGKEFIFNKVSKELDDMGVKEEDIEIISHLSKQISSII